MCDLDVGAVMVVDDGRLVGVLSERDVIRKVVCRERSTGEVTVGDIMTPSPKTIDATGDLAQALEIMSVGGFHHVPVMQDDRPIGLSSCITGTW